MITLSAGELSPKEKTKVIAFHIMDLAKGHKDYFTLNTETMDRPDSRYLVQHKDERLNRFYDEEALSNYESAMAAAEDLYSRASAKDDIEQLAIMGKRNGFALPISLHVVAGFNLKFMAKGYAQRHGRMHVYKRSTGEAIEVPLQRSEGLEGDHPEGAPMRSPEGGGTYLTSKGELVTLKKADDGPWVYDDCIRPDDQQDVFITMLVRTKVRPEGITKSAPAHYVIGSWEGKKQGRFISNGFDVTDDVIAWMPCPAPAKRR